MTLLTVGSCQIDLQYSMFCYLMSVATHFANVFEGNIAKCQALGLERKVAVESAAQANYTVMPMPAVSVL